MIRVLLALLLLYAAAQASAEGPLSRAHFNYQLFCQGCHGPHGDGGKGVPKIRGHIGVFLGSQAGREFLVRVPGAANAPLDNEQLAELMNWTVTEFAGDSLPGQWQYYSADEVAGYRKDPLKEVLHYRQALLVELLENNRGQQ